ncbi:hypothetical protein BC939DRAFT_435289 [Gamsiella multidivaricata]|uniref:uncharacterized protein n=1 Tax=Gamsiella multidivaricata TaxID=101098 RepID=UPI00221F9C2E|nr:uncharacterized protein BC939DRAFT_435289 [Gamsiella multidivaricata]KAI7832359.1 hypothetical protein BC939DRAFT_435289 [Gamsiella multidivaricata]
MSYPETESSCCELTLTDWLQQLQVARQQLCVDKRVPAEVWEKICSYLYPSQLSRLSRASRSLYELVASLKVWHSYYMRLAGTGLLNLFRRLPGTPLYKTYMQYIFALSYHICEGCSTFSRPLWNLQDFGAIPLPVLEWPDTVDPAKPNNRNIEPDREQCQSVIRLCRSCRCKLFSVHSEPILENAALEAARSAFGDAVGIRAHNDTPWDLIDRSRKKLDTYYLAPNKSLCQGRSVECGTHETYCYYHHWCMERLFPINSRAGLPHALGISMKH